MRKRKQDYLRIVTNKFNRFHKANSFMRAKKMDDVQKQVADLTQQEEEALLKTVPADEVRAKIIEEYGFDEEVDGDKIDKLVDERTKANKVISTAIKQKRTWREKAQEKKGEITPDKPDKQEKEALTLKDIRALNDVHDDDVDELVSYAKFKGIEVSEAKKLPEMAALLKDKGEKRATAAATNVRGGRPGKIEVSDTAIIDKAKKGELTPEEMEKAADVIMQNRRKAARGGN